MLVCTNIERANDFVRQIPTLTMSSPSVVMRYCDDLFDSESSTATIGVDFKVLHAHNSDYSSP